MASRGLVAAAPPAENPDDRPLCHGRAARPDRHAVELFDANCEDCEGRLWTYYNFGPFMALPGYRAWLDAACANPDRLYHAIRDNALGQAVGVAVESAPGPKPAAPKIKP